MLPVQSEFNVFFSWESDIKGAHSLLRKLLSAAAENVEKRISVKVAIDEATRDMAGSPDIVKCVTDKIDHCDLFVADITPVYPKSQREIKDANCKLCPNPNVMFELGYAVSKKGWNRIILLNLNKSCKSNDMPFDINHNRTDIISTDKKKDLTEHLALPIKEIITEQKFNYPIFYDTSRLDQNIKTEKYIEAIYIDDCNFRQQLRAFVDPYIFSEKLLSEVKMFSFDVANEIFDQEGKSQFQLNSDDIDFHSAMPFTDFFISCKEFDSRLVEADKELRRKGNIGYLNAFKIRRKHDVAQYLSSQICLITGNAGQGKTNLVCNLVKNILLKRSVPYLYVNGYELNPLDIGQSFISKAADNKYTSIEAMMQVAGKLCHRIHKPLIIIIDGLNEIPFNARLADNLNLFITKLTSYEFVKVILTCRQSYYSHYFERNISFKENMIVTNHIDRLRHDENWQDKLLGLYCQHFNIVLTISDYEAMRLTSNMLLLRIFCDVNRDKEIKHVKSSKYRLFQKFFELSKSRLATNLSKLTNNTIFEDDIIQYYDKIIGVMLDNNSLYELPIRLIKSELDDKTRNALNMFIDENILIKREANGKGEHISFTYDEFRDFLIAEYLVDFILPSNEEKFDKLIQDVVRVNTQEGVLPFILAHVYQSKNEIAKSAIKKKSWFEQTFALNIWDVDESLISKDDVEMLYSLIYKYPYRIGSKLFRRWDSKQFPSLNLSLLLKYLSTLEQKQLHKFITDIVPAARTGRLGENIRDKYTVRARFKEFLLMITNSEEFIISDSDKSDLLKMAAYIATIDSDFKNLSYKV